MRLKKKTARTRPEGFNLDALKVPQVAQALGEQITRGLETIQLKEVVDESVDISWKRIKEAIILPSKQLPQSRSHKKTDWMTEEILILMDQQRKQKNCIEEYACLDHRIRVKIKEQYLQELCSEIEQLQQKHDDFH